MDTDNGKREGGPYDDLDRIEIGGRSFLICAEPLYEESGERLSGEWHAWCFFAYDAARNVYPAEDSPAGIPTTESVAGETGPTASAARRKVAERLRTVIRTRDLGGTGFFSPPAGKTWPQDFAPTPRGETRPRRPTE
jgi:hypothetical protein